MQKLHKPHRKETPRHKAHSVAKKQVQKASPKHQEQSKRQQKEPSRKQTLNTEIDAYITRLRTSEKSEKDHLKFLRRFFARKPSSKDEYMEMENKPITEEEIEEEDVEDKPEPRGPETPKKLGFFARLFGKKHNAFNEEFEEGYVMEDTTKQKDELEMEETEPEEILLAPEEGKKLKTAHQENFKKILNKHKKGPQEFEKDIEDVIRDVEEQPGMPKTLADSLRSWVQTRDEEDTVKEKLHSETKLAAPSRVSDDKDSDTIRKELEDEERQLSEKIKQFELMKKELEELEQRQKERKRF